MNVSNIHTTTDGARQRLKKLKCLKSKNMNVLNTKQTTDGVREYDKEFVISTLSAL